MADSSTAGAAEPNPVVAVDTMDDLKTWDGASDDRVVRTLGYHEPGDRGGGTYRIRRTDAVPDGAVVIDLRGPYQAHLVPPETVTYALFGARGDGESDDGPAIKSAHKFANEHDLPVVNRTGEYWLRDTKEIPIKTDVSLGKTTIHIDEAANDRAPRFHVQPDEEPTELSAELKETLAAKIGPGTTRIPELAPYRHGYLQVSDETDRMGYRYSYDNHDGWAKEDFLYIEEHGRLVGDCCWTFDEITEAKVHQVPRNVLTIEGGTFLLSGTNSGDDGQYKPSGFHVTRSKTRIRDQDVGLEPGSRDRSTDPSSGFYRFQNVYDVNLADIRLFPREKSRPDDDELPSVPAGTYGIGGRGVFRGTFKNVTAEGSHVHWGVFGTNLFKDFRVEGCQLNRVDVHFHCHNLTIVDSDIGYKGITVTGSGSLDVANTTVTGYRFIKFRRDYGGKWSGPITITNSTLQPIDADRPASILAFDTVDFDYGYDIAWGHAIDIEGFDFDCSAIPDSTNVVRPVSFPSIDETGGRPIELPRRISLRHIQVRGRTKGIEGLSFECPRRWRVPTASRSNEEQAEQDTEIVLDSIDLATGTEDPADESGANVRIAAPTDDEDATGRELGWDAWTPRLALEGLTALRLQFRLPSGTVRVRDTAVQVAIFEPPDQTGVSTLFENCHFRPVTTARTRPCYAFDGTTMTRFSRCVWHPPDIDGEYTCQDVGEVIDAFAVNEWVQYDHLGSRLSAEFTEICGAEGNPVTQSFVNLLNHCGPATDGSRRRELNSSAD